MSAHELRERAIKALTKRDLSAHELRERLARHGSEEECGRVVDQLTGEGLQSDARTARTRARHGLQKGHTRTRVLAELAAAGIADAVAGGAVEEVFSDRDERAQLESQARVLVDRQAPRKEREKAARRLVAAGHEPEAVREALRLDHED